MSFEENIQLSQFTTMRIGGPAKYLCTIKSEADLIEAIDFSKLNNLEILVIGKGSNIVFKDSGFDGLVIVNEIGGIEIDTANSTILAGSGEVWDVVVEKSVEKNLIGIESLSLIPGTTGGAPVNNIGAYGQEIKDTILSVRAYDLQQNEFVDLNNSDCEFRYRDSIFKSSQFGRYIIISVKLQLKLYEKDTYIAPTYQSLTDNLPPNPTPKIVRETVIKVRTQKLPDPNLIANTGSFFKIPIVSNEVASKLLLEYPDMPVYDYKNEKKISAGWLIENCGLKDFRQNGIWVYNKQALVLVNESSNSFKDLDLMIQKIQSAVNDKFGIMLEIEPEII
jgi:UDP-N-acetylmuramate dehydrogenase